MTAKSSKRGGKRSTTHSRESTEANNRLGPEDWIKAAIDKLAEDNIDALRVDELAERLGVTKGSFYWHFKNREDLLAAVLDSWRRTMTSDIRLLIETLPSGEWNQVRRLLHIAISPRPDVPGGPFELSLRDWARRDKLVAKFVREVDDARVKFVTELYRAAGLDTAMARDFAEAQMAFVIGSQMTTRHRNASEFAKYRRIAELLLLPRHLDKSKN